MTNFFLNTIKRYASSYVMNILGLSFTFAAVIILSAKLYNEITFNRSLLDHERTYVVSYASGGFMYLSRPVVNDVLDKVSGIERGTLIQEEEFYYKYKNTNGDLVGSYIRKNKVTKEFIPMMGMEIIEGEYSSIKYPTEYLIPLSMAKRYFPNKSAVGETFLSSSNKEYVIVGVYKDFPENCSFDNVIYSIISDDQDIDKRNNMNYYLYIKADKGVSKSELESKVTDMLLISMDKQLKDEEKPILVNVVESYYKNEGGSLMMNYSIISVLVVLLIIASINFVNISIALVPRKVRPINILKVFGASNSKLRFESSFEAVLISLFSYVLALFIVYIYKMISPEMFIFSNEWLIYAAAFVLALVMGIIVSIYPTWYLTSFPPMIILSGNFALSPKGRRLRFILITFQYIVSFTLIIVSVMINMQYRYMLNKDLGYNTDQVAVFELSSNLSKQRSVIEENLKANPNIVDVTSSYLLFGAVSQGMGWGRAYSKGGFNVDVFPVSYNFLDFMEIKVDSGRTFKESDELSESGYFIMNRRAMDKYQFEQGELIYGHKDSTQIIGIVPNVNYYDLKQPIGEMCFYIYGKESWGTPRWFYAKIDNDIDTSIAHIRNVVAELDPAYTLNVELFDKKFERRYKKEQTFLNYMTQFGILSILISLIGVFGLIRYDSQFKLREIAIRKINGASVKDVLFSFCKVYLIITLIGFAIATPISLIIINKWLSGFPYKASVPIWIFIVALLFILIMTMAVIIFQSYRAATINPSMTIRKNQ